METANTPRLTFCGAAGTVTGSRYLLEWDGRRVLFDCGLFQGLKELRLRNWSPLPVPPESIDCVVLTHAHIDHSGLLPRLVENGFSGPIYCTHGTSDLCSLVLPDAGHLQEEDARLANLKRFSKHTPALPLFTEADAVQTLTHLRVVPYDTRTGGGDTTPRIHLRRSHPSRCRRCGSARADHQRDDRTQWPRDHPGVRDRTRR
jgi:metallo-beta-lactamase family protein